MSGSRDSDALIIGGEPRVDLLPPEVKAGNKATALLSKLGLILVVVLILVAGGVTAASLYSASAQARLAAAQARTDELFVEQTTYSEVRQIENEITLVKGALTVGASTEVDWQEYLTEVRAKLPGDVTVDTVTVESAAPFQLYTQPTAPLQSERVATLTIGLTSPVLPTVPAWLEALKELPGYADATPSSITRADTGTFEVQLTMHINGGAYSNRFGADASGTGTGE